MRFLPLLWMILAISVVVVGVYGVTVANFAFGSPLMQWIYWSLAVVDLVMAIVLAVWIRFRVEPSRIHGVDAFGLPIQMEWAAIETVRPFWFPGMPLLRIKAAGTVRELWLPLRLVDPRGFYAAVCEHAGADHVLSLVLARQKFDH